MSPAAAARRGREWNFFLPAEQGDYGERRVFKLDIVERDTIECARRLDRYLKYESMISSSAITAAREDYQNVARQNEMKSKLPQAWGQLIEGEDELLLELVAERVESLCGYKPDPDMVASFLKEYLASRTARPEFLVQPLRPHAPEPIPGSPIGKVVQPPAAVGFTLDGKHYPLLMPFAF